MSFRLRMEFKVADCWVGLFWRRSADEWVEAEGRTAVICTASRLDVWVCIIPMCPLHLVLLGAAKRSDPIENVVHQSLAAIAAELGWNPKCPRCSGCIGMTHHWIVNASEATTTGWYDCKHCGVKGLECRECGGEGCDECNHEGVIQKTFEFCPECGNRAKDTEDCLTCKSFGDTP